MFMTFKGAKAEPENRPDSQGTLNLTQGRSRLSSVKQVVHLSSLNGHVSIDEIVEPKSPITSEQFARVCKEPQSPQVLSEAIGTMKR